MQLGCTTLLHLSLRLSLLQLYLTLPQNLRPDVTMSGLAFHAGLSGHNVIAAPQAFLGGVINFNYATEKSNTAPTPGAFSTVPFQQDPDFVERPAITEWLRDTLGRPPHRAALVGLGGIG